jgi:hypothetical protein
MAIKRSNKGPIVKSSNKRPQLATIKHCSKLTPDVIAPPIPGPKTSNRTSTIVSRYFTLKARLITSSGEIRSDLQLFALNHVCNDQNEAMPA